jgi:hypothetical protein
VNFNTSDQSGNTIGARGVIFNYKPGDDKAVMARIATEIRAEMKPQILSKEKLFASMIAGLCFGTRSLSIRILTFAPLFSAIAGRLLYRLDQADTVSSAALPGA